MVLILCRFKKSVFTDARLLENASEGASSDLFVMGDNAGFAGCLIPPDFMGAASCSSEDKPKFPQLFDNHTIGKGRRSDMLI